MGKTYHGTYTVRKIGSDQIGIKLPDHTSGDYAVYEDDIGNFILEKVGDRGARQ